MKMREDLILELEAEFAGRRASDERAETARKDNIRMNYPDIDRLVLERELSTDPSLLILCNPMQGLDIQSQGALCKRLTAFAGKGKAVLVIGAADFPLSLCARVYTLESGMTQLSFTTKE
jgi:ABC-type uncharacterized transport system ATPase subunit